MANIWRLDWRFYMKFTYGDYPTKQEIITLNQGSKAAETIWEALATERHAKSNVIPLLSKEGAPFWFMLTPHLLQLITRIAEQRGFLDALSLSPASQKRLKEKATNHEAYYSSHIEGAQSSLEEALRFIKRRQKYSNDESLQMIKNNQQALEYAFKHIGQPVSHELICKLQLILTENTHRSRPITMGEYRRGPVYIVNGMGQVIYEGPPFQKVPEMMEAFVQWMNGHEAMSPLIRAGIVHLYFVHVHPFDDGNGRTARALSNLVLANTGFKFIHMLSLSNYFDCRRPSYYKAIQDVRAHEGDLTYFLIFFMEALASKLKDLRTEIEFEGKLNNLKALILPAIYKRLNCRQVKALRFMLRTKEPITTRKYCKLNSCSDETARQDFLHLVEWKLLKAVGLGRSRSYELKLDT